MQIGLFIRYGKLVPGREQQAIDLFRETSGYFTQKLDAGLIDYYEPFFFMTSDHEAETGFMIVKGPAPEIFRLMEDESYLQLAEKAMVLVEHFTVDLLTVGEGIELQLQRSMKVRSELGI